MTIATTETTGALSTIGNLIGPTLVVGALALMVLSRKHPGRLISRVRAGPN